MPSTAIKALPQEGALDRPGPEALGPPDGGVVGQPGQPLTEGDTGDGAVGHAEDRRVQRQAGALPGVGGPAGRVEQRGDGGDLVGCGATAEVLQQPVPGHLRVVVQRSEYPAVATATALLTLALRTPEIWVSRTSTKTISMYITSVAPVRNLLARG